MVFNSEKEIENFLQERQKRIKNKPYTTYKEDCSSLLKIFILGGIVFGWLIYHFN
tara:strand:+ start:1312 stop:1476 length:165 start_codon:yes stop_codon:yes gene_type:complete